MMDCKEITELMVEYIYQELDPAQAEQFSAHLRGCPTCTEELSAYQRTRVMMQELSEEEPPDRVTSFLLKEAAQQATPPSERVSLWDRLRDSMRLVVLHPAMTVAVTLVLVLGVSFFVYQQGMPISEPGRPDPLEVEVDRLPAGRTATITAPQDTPANAPEEAPTHDETAQGAAQGEPAAPADQIGTMSNRYTSKGGYVTLGRGGGDMKKISTEYQSAKASARERPHPTPPSRRSRQTKWDTLAKDKEGSAGLDRDDGTEQKRALTAEDQPLTRAARVSSSNEEAADLSLAGTGASTDRLVDGNNKMARQPSKAEPGPRMTRPSKAPMQEKVAAKPAVTAAYKPKSMPAYKQKPTPPSPSTAAPLSNLAQQRGVDDLTYKKKGKRRVQPRKGPDPLAIEQAKKIIAQGDKAVAEGRCMAALEYYQLAVQQVPHLMGSVSGKIRSCAASLARSDKKQLAKVLKIYPRFSRILVNELEKTRKEAARSAERKKAVRSKGASEATQK